MRRGLVGNQWMETCHGRRRWVATWQLALLPSTLVLHHSRRDGRGRAGQGHAGIWIDDGDDLAGARRGWLLEIHLIHITGDPGMRVRVGRSRRQGDGRGDLLHGLDLVLQRRGVGGTAGKRRPVGGGGMDGVQLRSRDCQSTVLSSGGKPLVP